MINLKLSINKEYYWLILFLILLFIISTALSLEANEIKKETRLISLEKIDSLMIKAKFGVGKLNLNCGEKNTFEANFQYEKSFLKPNIHYETIGENGVLNLSQSIKKDINLFFPYNNIWSLKLPSNIPLQLYINTATYSGDINLTNLQIEDFYLTTGASQTNIEFNQPNLIDLENINIKTGASTIKIIGLSNANFDSMDFTGGAGNYTFDFSGNLAKKSKVNINVGAAKVILKIPSAIGTKISFKQFPLAKLNVVGFIKINEQVYVNPEYGKSNGELDIEIKGGLLDVEVVLLSN